MSARLDDYEHTLAWLYRLEARAGMDLKLERVARAAAALGHPERAVPAIHIAGTNGKGSTAAMAAAILGAAGRRVGLYTSPHLVSFRERIMIAGERITTGEVTDGVARIRRTLGASLDLTCFEMITLLAWGVFAARRVECAVLEVGLGGRLDATNIVVPEVSVITNVGRDHEAFLGSEIAAIAAEKAGIIKARVPVVSGATGEAACVVRERAAMLASPLEELDRDFAVALAADGNLTYRSPLGTIGPIEIGLAGAYQLRNAALAVRALELAPGLAPDAGAVRVGLAAVRLPGRLQIVRREPLVILDGAHNPAGIEVVAEEVRRLAAGRPVRVLFGVMRDKAWGRMLESIGSVATEIVMTRPSPARSADPDALARAAPGAVTVDPDPVGAYHRLVARSEPTDVVLVTGSLFLIGDVLPLVDPSLEPEVERERRASRLAGR